MSRYIAIYRSKNTASIASIDATVQLVVALGITQRDGFTARERDGITQNVTELDSATELQSV